MKNDVDRRFFAEDPIFIAFPRSREKMLLTDRPNSKFCQTAPSRSFHHQKNSHDDRFNQEEEVAHFGVDNWAG
jgi:hypothetical protein